MSNILSNSKAKVKMVFQSQKLTKRDLVKHVNTGEIADILVSIWHRLGFKYSICCIECQIFYYGLFLPLNTNRFLLIHLI